MTQEALKLALDKKADNARELGLDYEPENTLHWHALNYRTAPTQNAQAMFEALEKFVEAAIKEALREHAMREVQRLGQEPVKYSDYEPDGVRHNKPPQRTWVGLTDEEYAELAEEFGPFPINQIEAKLKEKNT